MKTIIFIIGFFVPTAISKPIIGKMDCSYMDAEPIYTETISCGRFCSGVISCVHPYFPFQQPLIISVACPATERGKCPSAHQCHKDNKKPGKVFFMDKPSNYEKRKSKTKKARRPGRKRTRKSGATR